MSTTPHTQIAERIVANQIGAASPAVSPDGSHVAYVVTRVDHKANKYRSQVWLARADGSTPPRPLNAGEKCDGNPSWSPDGTWLAFTSGRSEKKGETTLCIIPIGTSGEIRTIATMPDGVTTPYVPEGCEHVGHVYHLRFGNLAQRTRFITALKNQQISAVFHYQALHMSPVGQHFGGYVGQCPVAEHASDCLVRLPLFNSMTDDQQLRVIEAVQQFVPLGSQT